MQSHALSFFHLSAPDMLLGFDSDPARRNVFGMIADYPALAKDGIALRKFGQQVIEALAKERIHPSWTVPGGVNAPLDPAVRERMIENSHTLRFEHWAAMWGIEDRVTELRPDAEASRRAWERYDALW